MGNYFFLSSLLWLLVPECFGLTGALTTETKVTTEKKEVTIYFIRHAQSTWNEAKAEMGKRWFGSVMKKFSNWRHVSSFKDAPLTKTGKTQVTELSNWFWNNQAACTAGRALFCFAQNVWGVGKGPVANAGIVTSPADTLCKVNAMADLKRKIYTKDDSLLLGASTLDRAIETLALFLGKEKNGKTIHILSSLQEASGGADAQSKLGKQTRPDTTKQDSKYKGLTFDVTKNEGNQDCQLAKDPFYYTKRFNNFCDFLFSDDMKSKSTYLLSGHSYWLMYFYILSFGRINSIPRKGSEFEGDSVPNAAELLLRLFDVRNIKKIKLGNASMITFKVVNEAPKGEGVETQLSCHVVPASTQMIYGNWQVSAKCNNEKNTCGDKKQEFCPCNQLEKYLSGSVKNVEDAECPAPQDDD